MPAHLSSRVSARTARLWLPAAAAALAVESALPRREGAAQMRPPKRIVVSVGQQSMWAYERAVIVLSSLVSTGKAGFGTPLGRFQILTKYESQTMAGTLQGETYNIPDVPDVMYFTNQGHALHGCYWHSNFGTAMSHGCVNLPLDVAATLFNWAPVGTPVVVVQ